MIGALVKPFVKNHGLIMLLWIVGQSTAGMYMEDVAKTMGMSKEELSGLHMQSGTYMFYVATFLVFIKLLIVLFSMFVVVVLGSLMLFRVL